MQRPSARSTWTTWAAPPKRRCFDVCSYPSEQPNSDPSDCVVISDTKGILEVIKDVDPDDPATNWVINVVDSGGNTDFSVALTGDDNTGILAPVFDTYIVSEAAGLNTDLANYTTTYSCTKNGTAYLSGSGTSISNVVIGKNGSVVDTVICTFKNTRKANADLTVTKTAATSLTRTYAWNIAKSVDKTEAKIAEGGSALFNYTVDVTHDAGTDSLWAVSGKITVSNSNAFAVAGVNITDAIDNGGSCSVTNGANVTVPAAVGGTPGTLTVDYTCSFGSNPGTGTNTATATWDKATYYTVSGSAQGTASYDFANATVNRVDESVQVSDANSPNPPLPATVTFAGPAKTTFTYAKSYAGVAGTCKNYDNTASFVANDTGATGSSGQTVTVCVGKDVTVAKTAAGTFDRAYTWQIAKSVDKDQVNIPAGGLAGFDYTVTVSQTGFNDSGWTLSGKITITNPNDWQAITLTGLADVVDNGGLCTVAPGPYVVPKSGSIEVAYSCAYAAAPSSYSGTNTATATWDKAAYFTPTGSASGTSPFTLTQAGSTNKTVHVTDSLGGALGSVTAADAAPFTTAEFTYTESFPGESGTCKSYDNTATITETAQTASATVTVCVGVDLTVSKTAAATLDRTYKWLIDKSVDTTKINIAQGGTATFNYGVKVTPNGYTDSGWTLGGAITIVNPNDWQAVTVSVSDTLDKGGTCAITEVAPYVVPKSGSLTLHYTCTTDGSATKNTATATWDKAVYFTPTGSASAEAPVAFGIAKETNKVITVVDDKTVPGSPVTLGTWNWADGEHTFTYSLSKMGVAGTCTDYTNIAIIQETQQSDSQKVTVCVGLDLTVTKTAAGTYDRLYKWTIDKSVDETNINIAEAAPPPSTTPSRSRPMAWLTPGGPSPVRSPSRTRTTGRRSPRM